MHSTVKNNVLHGHMKDVLYVGWAGPNPRLTCSNREVILWDVEIIM